MTSQFDVDMYGLKQKLKQFEWISVKNKLPGYKKGGRTYLCYQEKTKTIAVSWYEFKNFGLTEITHWMPLPKPPIN